MPERDPVDDMLQESANVEIPPDVEARMHRQLAEFRARLDRRRRPTSDRVAALVGRRPMRWALAATALLLAVAMAFVWGGPDGGRVYASAVSNLAKARSVRYTIEIAPFVGVEFSHLSPGHERVSTSWGIEIRADGSGAQLILLHGSKQYVRDHHRQDSLLRTADLIDQLRSLPATADARLGERTVAGVQVVGYRVEGRHMTAGHGVELLDLWLDARSGKLDHVDISPSGAGRSGYQMHIRDIGLDADLDPALFDMTPPAGYVDATSAHGGGQSESAVAAGLTSFPAQMIDAPPQSVVVVRQSGPYQQAPAALDRVMQHLRRKGVVPTGPPFGRFESEARWEVGYPVPAGTNAEPPFEVMTLLRERAASQVVHGPWGRASSERWTQLLRWLDERGYLVVGPPTEIWTGDDRHPESQVTEMRVAVAPRSR
jgi:effector-binding domain-containing protein